MKRQRSIMGMPVTIEIAERQARDEDIQDIFSYLHHIDEVFSTYKETSEIQRINRGELPVEQASEEVRTVLALAEQTKKQTDGYFDIYLETKLDPSGLVKGYAINESAKQLREKGYKCFSIEIAGDIQVVGTKNKQNKWRVGIRNPFTTDEIVKVVAVVDKGVATSGTYMRGQHIYDPTRRKSANAIMSMTVIAADIYDADRFATAAFAMGEKGIHFIESMPGLEGYMITKDRRAQMTSGFTRYVVD